MGEGKEREGTSQSECSLGTEGGVRTSPAAELLVAGWSSVAISEPTCCRCAPLRFLGVVVSHSRIRENLSPNKSSTTGGLEGSLATLDPADQCARVFLSFSAPLFLRRAHNQGEVESPTGRHVVLRKLAPHTRSY